MSIYMEFDKETNKVDLFADGELVKQFTPVEARELIEEVSYLKEYHRQDLYKFNKVKLVDIEEMLEDKNRGIEEVISIDLTVEKMTSCAPDTSVSLTVHFEDGDYENLEEVSNTLADNFEAAKIWFGTISTHELRECMHESILTFLKDSTGVAFSFCGKIVSKEYLLNVDKVQFYEAKENSNT